MTYRGKFSKGTVILPRDVDIPEGAEVEVTTVSTTPNGDAKSDEGPTLYETLKDFIGVCDGPEDFAENHDHYIHGTPKRVK